MIDKQNSEEEKEKSPEFQAFLEKWDMHLVERNYYIPKFLMDNPEKFTQMLEEHNEMMKGISALGRSG